MKFSPAQRLGFWIVGTIIAIGLIGLVVWAAWGLVYNATTYRAVFLTNGQVYFGKTYFGFTNPLVLHDIYYLQQQDTTNSTNQSSLGNGQIQLIKLGNEIHGPKDIMRINREQVLFVEDLRPDSQVVQLIHQFKASGNQPPTSEPSSPAPSSGSSSPSPSHS